MNASRKFLALCATGGFALAVSLSAQNPSSSATPASGAKSPAIEKSPVSNKPPTPNRPATDPTVGPAPTDQTPGAGLTPGAANSGSGAGGRETVRPDLGTVNDPASTRTKPTVATPQFNTMDTDRDGRISATEFTAPSAGWLQRGTSNTGAVNGAPGTRGPLDRPSPGTMPRSSGGSPNSTAAENHTKLFQELDTNHDGYLSPTELETYRAPTTSER